MPVCTISLRLDATQCLADLQLLADTAKRSKQLCRRLIDFGDIRSEFACVQAEPSFAAGAGELWVRLQFSNRLAELVSAVRAGHFD